MAARNSRRGPRISSSILTPHGQVRFIENIFRTEKVRRKRDPSQDMSAGKIWMRAHIRSKIEVRAKSAIFSRLPPEMPKMVANGNAREFVELIAKRRYGQVNRENMLLAQKDSLRLTRMAKTRHNKLIAATNGIREMFTKLPKKENETIRKRRVILGNALDSFAHVLAEGGYLELFEMDLQGLKF